MTATTLQLQEKDTTVDRSYMCIYVVPNNNDNNTKTVCIRRMGTFKLH